MAQRVSQADRQFGRDLTALAMSRIGATTAADLSAKLGLYAKERSLSRWLREGAESMPDIVLMLYRAGLLADDPELTALMAALAERRVSEALAYLDTAKDHLQAGAREPRANPQHD